MSASLSRSPKPNAAPIPAKIRSRSSEITVVCGNEWETNEP